jgi:hypothetical protein
MKALGRSLERSRCLFAALALTSVVVAASLCVAAPAAGPLSAPGIIQADWQGPLSLPPRFRNHCAIDAASGRPYCSDHCGFEYQFYYCTQLSFGCCRIGFGYCDWRGQLRCNP